jgi:hypothetical protein
MYRRRGVENQHGGEYISASGVSGENIINGVAKLGEMKAEDGRNWAAK